MPIAVGDCFALRQLRKLSFIADAAKIKGIRRNYSIGGVFKLCRIIADTH